MAPLPNRFSWSFSAAEDFEQCRRLRYWSKYAKWGGWEQNASPLQRAAYRLDKMDNRYALRGRAVEEGVRWMLRESQAGRPVSAEDAYRQIARPLLNRSWKESLDRQWQENPKRFCCLHEHYYPSHQTSDPETWIPRIVETTQRCFAHFVEKVLPRLAGVEPSQEIHVASAAESGDPESFDLHGVKVYAIPDYAYCRGDGIHIHDWKSGAPKPGHVRQVSIYGQWAHLKHGFDPARIQVTCEYLADGTTHQEALSAARLAAVTEAIGESVADMAAYLVQEDRERNLPLPRELWELTIDRSMCRRCRFHELCAPELGR
jgi:hypothetical protein